MRLSRMLKGVKIEVENVRDIEIKGLALDSNKVEEDFLFAALPGTKIDGAKFIPDAIKRGAAAVLTKVGANIDYKFINDNDVEVLPSTNPHKAISLLAANFFETAPENIAAVTGTNGKTSIANMMRQMFEIMGKHSASLGTIGVVAKGYPNVGSLTTPDPITLHRILSELSEIGVTHAAIEASSHGLEQFRLDGVKIKAAAFTNLTRDHLDYHGTMNNYFKAKQRLFLEILDENGTAVINADTEEYKILAKLVLSQNKKLFSYGFNGDDIRIKNIKPNLTSQELDLTVFGKDYKINLPLVGEFQAINAACALGLAIALGADINKAVLSLEKLKCIPGRLELAAERLNGAKIFVDYAHTPDGLYNVLKTLKPIVKGELQVLFGAGGDRDTGKRSQMGQVACKYADKIYVTDDNPRSEDPEEIRKMILSGCDKETFEIADRKKAIFDAVKNLKKDDVLVLAGKGHETGQIIKGKVIPFDDRIFAKQATEYYDTGAITSSLDNKEILYTSKTIASIVSGRSKVDIEIAGVSIDHLNINNKDLFIALKGKECFAKIALENGAACVMVEKAADNIPLEKQIIVLDTYVALSQLAKYARETISPKVITLTGGLGKSVSAKLIRTVLSSYDPIAYSTENKVEDTLCMLAGMSKKTKYAIIEADIEKDGEIKELSTIAKPDVAVIPWSGFNKKSSIGQQTFIAKNNTEIFANMDSDATIILNRDDELFEHLTFFAKTLGLKNLVTFGTNKNSFIKLNNEVEKNCKTFISINQDDKEFNITMNVTGDYWGINTACALAALYALGISSKDAIACFCGIEAEDGNGKLISIPYNNGKITLIDSSKSACGKSLDTAINALSKMNGRKIAVIGEIKAEKTELVLIGDKIANSNIDLVYCIGKDNEYLYSRLNDKQKAGIAKNPSDILGKILENIEDKDNILVKGIKKSNIKIISDALRRLSSKKDSDNTFLF